MGNEKGNVSPNIREVHQEQAESSEHQGNNTELMEMLKSMKQEMQDRDMLSRPKRIHKLIGTITEGQLS